MNTHVWFVEWRHVTNSRWTLLYGQFHTRKEALSYIRGCEAGHVYRVVKYVRQGKPC